MKPTLMTAVVMAVLSVVSPAGATPVVPITGGFVVSEESSAGDVCGAVSGPRFAFSGCNTAAGTGGWPGPTAGTTNLGVVIGDNHAALVMGFTFDALPQPHRGDPDLIQPFKMTGAFFADGLEGPPDFDVVAHGQMSVLWRLHEFTTFPQWIMHFDFGGRGPRSLGGTASVSQRGAMSLSVDDPSFLSEPSTIALLAVALAIIAAIRARRRGSPRDGAATTSRAH